MQQNENQPTPDEPTIDVGPGPTRRRFIQLGLAGSAAAFLAACGSGGGSDSNAETSAAGGSDSSGAADTTGADGSTQSSASSQSGTEIVYAVQAFTHEALAPIIADFTAETGISVKLEGGPATGQDLLTQLIPAFSSNSTPYDVFDVDDPSCSAFVAAGHLSPLNSALTDAVMADFGPGMKTAHELWNTRDGDSFRIYHNWEIGYYWLRQDVLDAEGLSAPTTWEELVTVGKQVKDATGMWAFADAASKPGLAFVYMAYLNAGTGSDLYSFDDGVREAFQYAYDLIHTHELFPEEALTWTYDQLNAAYMDDKLMSMREWTFFDGVARENTAWYDESKVAVVQPPAGPAGAKTWAGGWGYAVPKASKNQEAALKFVEWMSSNDVAVRLAEASSFFITARESVLGKLGQDGIYSHMKAYSENDWVAPRPYHVKAAQAETVIDDIAQSFLTGQITIDQAMEDGQRRMKDL